MARGGTKSFQNPDDKPEGWPEEHSFQKLGHPSHATLDVSNDIIISLLSFHGFDADTHPFEAIEPEPAPKKRKKSQKATTFIEDEEQEQEVDPNDNSIHDESEGESKKRRDDEESSDDQELDDFLEQEIANLSKWEKIREQNIREREAAMKEAGLIPHSKEIRSWK